MSHIIELTDEQYETLRQAAEERGETLEALVAALIYQLRDDQTPSHAFATDEWFHHLGASEEQITEAKRIARERGDANT
jgi:hypothetical protein